jgi:hypothetical protein
VRPRGGSAKCRHACLSFKVSLSQGHTLIHMVVQGGCGGEVHPAVSESQVPAPQPLHSVFNGLVHAGFELSFYLGSVGSGAVSQIGSRPPCESPSRCLILDTVFLEDARGGRPPVSPWGQTHHTRAHTRKLCWLYVGAFDMIGISAIGHAPGNAHALSAHVHALSLSLRTNGSQMRLCSGAIAMNDQRPETRARTHARTHTWATGTVTNALVATPDRTTHRHSIRSRWTNRIRHLSNTHAPEHGRPGR